MWHRASPAFQTKPTQTQGYLTSLFTVVSQGIFIASSHVLHCGNRATFCVWWKLIIVVVQWMMGCCFRRSICHVTSSPALCYKWDLPRDGPKGSQITPKTYFCMVLDLYRYWYLESGLTLIQETRCTTQVSVHSAQLVSTAFWWLSGDPLFTQRSPMYCGWHNSQHRLVRSKVRSLVLEIRWWPMLWKRVEKGKWWLFNKSEK